MSSPPQAGKGPRDVWWDQHGLRPSLCEYMNADRLRFRRMKLLDRSLLRLKRADETIDTAVQYRIIRYSGKIGTSSSAPPKDQFPSCLVCFSILKPFRPPKKSSSRRVSEILNHGTALSSATILNFEVLPFLVPSPTNGRGN